jgi:hypothetical protein
MNALIGAPPPPPRPAAQPHPPTPPLRIVDLDHAAPLDSRDVHAAALRRAARGPWHAASIYAGAGLVYAAVMTAGSRAAEGYQGNWLQMAVLTAIYVWPAVLAAMLVAAHDAARRVQVLGAYAGVLAALAIRGAAGNPDVGLLGVPKAWVFNLPGTLLLLTFLWQSIRAVGPLVLAFLLMAVLGSQGVLWLASDNDAVLRAVASVGQRLGQEASGIFWGLVLLGALAFAVALGRPLLRWIGRRYEAKAFSDRSLTVDALFLVFAVTHGVFLAFEGASWFLTGAVAFAGYKVAASLAFRLRGGRGGRGRTLLLLRVFRLGRRSERLFDKVRRHWQEVGSISLVAGPDLVTALIEPHEFLDFLGGGLNRRFVSGVADLERRVATADLAPDPDGRYRVNEFFCRSDTWQATMQRLAAVSDVVLMDLRSFSSSNTGCLDEIGYLLDGVDLAHVVFLVDESTDRPLLDASLQAAWQQARLDSPNREVPQPVARLFYVHRQSEREIVALLRHLLSAAPGSSGAGDGPSGRARAPTQRKALTSARRSEYSTTSSQEHPSPDPSEVLVCRPQPSTPRCPSSCGGRAATWTTLPTLAGAPTRA